MRKIFILLLLPIFLTACTEDEEASIIAIDLDGIEENTYINSGEILEMPIKAFASEVDLTNFKLECYNKYDGKSTLIDSMITGKSFVYDYYYRAPLLQGDTTEVSFTVTFTNASGYTNVAKRQVNVVRQDGALDERSGVMLYCNDANGSRPNAYCFSEMTPVITSVTDSAKIDMYIPAPEIGQTVVREWLTNTDINFARNNSFDFSNATDRSVQASYSTSIHNPKITDIKDGDIILIGRNSIPLGVIQVVDILDPDNINESRYLLNIKVIKH